MHKHTEWFCVSKEGLKAQQLGKPRFHAIRELIQNAFDEEIMTCDIRATHQQGKAEFVIEDDSLKGFRNLNDAYTLFLPSYKRPYADKRGYMNVGEKMAFAICESATIETTLGAVTFDKAGRHFSNKMRERGTKVSMTIKMNKDEYDEIMSNINLIIPPEKIKFTINGNEVKPLKWVRIFNAKLQTVILYQDRMQRTVRMTRVALYDKQADAYLYEMGIPVCKIDCKYSIDVNQRVPMSVDRDMVAEAYLQDLFAEVLNNTSEDIKPEESSSLWVRTGMSDERVEQHAVQDVIKQRYGEKVVVSTPNDPISDDDALASGFRVVHGKEMSEAEWENVRRFDVVQSSKEVFGKEFADATTVEPDENMLKVGNLAKKIMKRIHDIDIEVRFIKSKATERANYGDRTLTFNVSLCKFQQPIVNAEVLALIVHELAHQFGHHTEMKYHEAICELGARLTMIALKEPSFFT